MQTSKNIIFPSSPSSPSLELDPDLVEFLRKANIGEGPGQEAFVCNYAGEMVHWLDFAATWNAQLKKVKAIFKDRPLPNLHIGMLADLNNFERLT